MLKRIVAVISRLDKELFPAIERNDLPAIADLLDRGASLEAKHQVWHELTENSVKTYTPLGYAVEQNNVTAEVVELLLNRGAKVNDSTYIHAYNTEVCDISGRDVKEFCPPLHRAIAKNNRAKVQCLLRHGADPEKQQLKITEGSLNPEMNTVLDVSDISLTMVRFLVLKCPKLESKSKSPKLIAVKRFAEEERVAISEKRDPDYSENDYQELYSAFFTMHDWASKSQIEFCPSPYNEVHFYLLEQPNLVRPLLRIAQDFKHNSASNFLRSLLPIATNHNASEMQASSSSSEGSSSNGYPQPAQPQYSGAASSSSISVPPYPISELVRRSLVFKQQDKAKPSREPVTGQKPPRNGFS